MKNLTKICFFGFFFLHLPFAACSSENELKIGVVSDIHYLSEQLMDNGSAINSYIEASGRNITDVPNLIDVALNNYIKNGIDILLIPGDLTKDGEEQSHKDLVKKLAVLKEKGIRVFVIPGNHDINMPNAKSYKGDVATPVKNINPKDFETIYNDFGYAQSTDRDAASLSYVAKLNNQTWLIAIDGCRYQEYTTQSISGGRVKPETEQWVVAMLQKAKMQNKQVVAMMHHGLVEHIMYQEMVFPQYLVDDWKRLANLFADNGMRVIFTGHAHANDITEFTSVKGNKLNDIETGSLISYPFPYRYVVLDDKKMDIKTHKIASLPTNIDLVETNKAYLRTLTENMVKNKVKSFGFDIPADVVEQIASIAGEIFLLHVAGDEVMTPDLRSKINALSELMGQSAALNREDIKLDFFPADNDVRIIFEK